MQQVINAGLALGMAASLALAACAWHGKSQAETRLRANVPASFNPTVDEPRVGAGTYIDPLASVIGDVRLGRRSMVAPFASIRGDEGQPIRIGSRTNIQDGVVLHALETVEGGEVIEKNLVEHNGKKYAIYIGDEVSLAHQSQVHGPAKVGDRTFVGMQSLVFKSEVGEDCVLEPAAKVIGVKIAPGHYVPAGAVITTQAQADALPVITADYAYRGLNDGVVHVNTQLADGYLGNGRVDAGEEEPTAKEKPSATPATGVRSRAPATPTAVHGETLAGAGRVAVTPAPTPRPTIAPALTPIAAATTGH